MQAQTRQVTQAQTIRIFDQQRKRMREEILADIEKSYQKILAEKDELRSQVDKLQGERLVTDEKIDNANDRIEQIEKRMDKLEKSTFSAVRRAEEKLERSLRNVENRVETSNKTLQSMTQAVVGGFCAITLAVIVLFITLILKA